MYCGEPTLLNTTTVVASASEATSSSLWVCAPRCLAHTTRASTPTTASAMTGVISETAMWS